MGIGAPQLQQYGAPCEAAHRFRIPKVKAKVREKVKTRMKTKPMKAMKEAASEAA